MVIANTSLSCAVVRSCVFWYQHSLYQPINELLSSYSAEILLAYLESCSLQVKLGDIESISISSLSFPVMSKNNFWANSNNNNPLHSLHSLFPLNQPVCLCTDNADSTVRWFQMTVNQGIILKKSFLALWRKSRCPKGAIRIMCPLQDGYTVQGKGISLQVSLYRLSSLHNHIQGSVNIWITKYLWLLHINGTPLS